MSFIEKIKSFFCKRKSDDIEFAGIHFIDENQKERVNDIAKSVDGLAEEMEKRQIISFFQQEVKIKRDLAEKNFNKLNSLFFKLSGLNSPDNLRMPIKYLRKLCLKYTKGYKES